MIKVSVIVPIYNTKKYLKNCIDSLINQTEKNIEIILINDGSSEDISSIINSYNDNRIRYYKRKNHGIGATRNFGIKESNGEYILFLDSDDYILPNCIEELYNKANKDNCDLVICDYYEKKDDTLKEIKITDFKDTKLINNTRLLTGINLGPCNKLYKSKMLKENNIEFVENLKYEDAPFVTKAIIKSDKIGKISKPLTIYVIHNNSETTTIDKRVFDILKICDIIIEEMSKYEYLNEEKTNLIVMILADYLMKQRFINNRKERNRFIDEAFKKLNQLDKNWRKCYYLKIFPLPKRIVKVNKMLTKIYCSAYNLTKKRNS